MTGARAWLGVSVLALAPACARDNAAGSSASAVVPQEARLDLSGDAPWPAPYSTDPLWVRAGTGDDFDRARLGRREDAESLLAAVRAGGSLGRVALAALPYASDRRSQRGALCELCGRAEPASLSALLDALLDVVMNAPRTEEGLDPAPDARCTGTLEAIARAGSATPAEADRAAAVLARLRAP